MICDFLIRQEEIDVDIEHVEDDIPEEEVPKEIRYQANDDDIFEVRVYINIEIL